MNFGKMIWPAIVNAVWELFKIFLNFAIPVAVGIVLFFLIILCFYLKYRFIDGIKPQKAVRSTYKNPGLLKTILYLWPKQVAYDYVTQDPSDFSEFGIHCVIGEQGSGKSMTVCYLLKKWKAMYPEVKIYTNMGYRDEDASLSYWQELITRTNGKKGVVNVVDDLKAWWSNKDSKDLPAEVLGEICQQRKQKKALVSTIQVFSEAPKAFRSQTHYLYVPRTILGSLTIVLKTKAKWYDSEKDKFKKYCGFFIFAHTKELREAYDTFKKIEKYKDYDFARNEQFCEVVPQLRG